MAGCTLAVLFMQLSSTCEPTCPLPAAVDRDVVPAAAAAGADRVGRAASLGLHSEEARQ